MIAVVVHDVVGSNESWYNDTGTARISQVEDNLIAVQITQDFHQAATLETVQKQCRNRALTLGQMTNDDF